MDEKLYVTLASPDDARKVRDAGCNVLAEYPDSLVVRASDDQKQALATAGVEAVSYEQRPVQVGGASFLFSAAEAANAAEPAPAASPDRRAYYLVSAVGPIKGEWLDAVRSLGGVIQGNLPGHNLLVGLLPPQAEALRQQAWVEGITPYRAGMKVSPKLRSTGGPHLLEAQLAAIGPEDLHPQSQMVEVSVFSGESTAEVAAIIRTSGGTVIQEGPRTVTATVSPTTISRIAAQPGVESILPYKFPKLRNDRASQVMGVPTNHTFGATTYRGAGQLVAIGDSGVDTGNPATLHADFRGRIDTIVSFPTNPALAPYTLDGPSHDDGPADLHSAHGTHVTGSVLGNGAAAANAGTAEADRPAGLAPEAHAYFQAVEQSVRWRSRSQLAAAGLQPFDPDWPPPAASLWGLPNDLTTLFQPAFTAGARIHTNSWGADDNGAYSSNSRDVDSFMFNHRDFLILVAGGNAGVDDDGDGLIDADSIGSPATAKNCLTVGASENNRPHGSTPTPGIDANWSQLQGFATLTHAGHVSDNPDGMAGFSSRGPVDGGRIKPDVVAPGTNILSTRSSVFQATAAEPEPLWGDLQTGDPLHGLYCWSGGTSMATPLVAGAAALVREYLVNTRGHQQDGVKPSGALIKAMLIHGATSMAGQFPNEIPDGPNSVDGFGRINLSGVLVDGTGQFLFDDEPAHAVESGQMRAFQVDGVSATQPFKATLVWSDAPGPVGTGSLQNRLYLQVVRPDGTIVAGDVSAFPNATNNVQQVTIRNPSAGTYRVRVRGVSIVVQSPGAAVAAGANPRQDFALVVSNGTGLTLP